MLHALAFVHGNHDLEFYWDAVKDDLCSLLLARACAARTDAVDRAAFDRRIAFHPLFFYVAGLVYIEHGHQYDAFCASQYVMAPLAADPRRMTRTHRPRSQRAHRTHRDGARRPTAA